MRIGIAFLALLLCAAAAPFDPFGMARIVPRIGAEIPIDLTLTDQNGRPVRASALAAGRPILLAPVQYDCPTLCGVELDALVGAMASADIGADEVAVFGIGIDPREGPDRARDALRRLGERHERVDVTALTGPTAPITDALGYRYAWDERMRQYAHVAAVAVLTPDGRLSSWLKGMAIEPAALREAVATARAGRAGNWTDRLALLCYNYDPVTGRYTIAVMWLLRIVALATLGALAAYILVSRLRERRG